MGRGTAQPLTPRQRQGSHGGCHLAEPKVALLPELGHSAAHPRSPVSYALYNSVCYLGSWLCLSHKALDRRHKGFHHSASTQ